MQFVVFGVIVHAFVVSIMVVNWAELIFKKCESETMVLVILLFFSFIGLLSTAFLLWFRRKKYENLSETKRITFLKIKLISLYVFGIGYLFHCALYAWKHSIKSNDCGNDKLGIIYNVSSIVYTFGLFVYFAIFYERNYDNGCWENLCSLGILFANSCIWLDSLFSHSGVLFKNHNHTSTNSNETNSTIAMQAIEKTDPFLSPAMIEFSLMAIDMLFTKTDDYDEDSLQIDPKNPENTTCCNCETCRYACRLFRLIGQISLSLVAFALFAFTFSVFLTTNSSEELLDHSEYFEVYVSMQLSMKVVMFLLIVPCLIFKWPRMTFHFNVWSFVLIITCFGNVVYHVLYCFALWSNGKENVIIVSWTDNIVSIFLAGFQTLFILGTHLHSDQVTACCTCSPCINNCKNKESFVYYACSILGVLNFGLWVSDSIGEERLPVFSIEIYKAYDEVMWSVINKIILPLTIFFRFHTGLDFFEFYWKHKNKKIKIKKKKLATLDCSTDL